MCPFCDGRLRPGCLECLYPGCKGRISYAIDGPRYELDAAHPAPGGAPPPSPEVAQGLAEEMERTGHEVMAREFGAAVRGGVPRRVRSFAALQHRRTDVGQASRYDRKHARHTEQWDAQEDYRLRKAAIGATRENPKADWDRAWVPRHAHDVWPGSGRREATAKSGVVPNPKRVRD
ncbi:MAG: hypothetical protein GY772_23900 [bacterium]|nr:hypothetical protein [bacterium]